MYVFIRKPGDLGGGWEAITPPPSQQVVPLFPLNSPLHLGSAEYQIIQSFTLDPEDFYSD